MSLRVPATISYEITTNTVVFNEVVPEVHTVLAAVVLGFIPISKPAPSALVQTVPPKVEDEVPSAKPVKYPPVAPSEPKAVTFNKNE